MALTDSLRILITANGAQATREFQRVGSAAQTNLGKVESGAKRFGRDLVSAGAGVAAFAGIAYFGLSRAAEAADLEAVAIDKLNNSIDNSPALVGASTDAFLEQAAAMQDTTKFADDATISAQAMLGTFRLNQDEILALTPLVADLASKFDVDMNRAAVNVGKAMMGSSSALQRWGVVIDEDAFATDRFGAVLSALRENAGGFAEQEGQRLSGQLAIMRNNLGDIAETIGTEVTPMFTDLATTVTSVAEAFTGGFVGDFLDELGPVPDILEGIFARIRPDALLGDLQSAFGAVTNLTGNLDQDLSNAYSDSILASAAVIESLGSVAIASSSAAAGITAEGEAAEESAAALDQLTQRQDAYLERALGLGDARDELASSFNSLYQSLLTGSRAFRGNGQAAIENRAALDQLVVGTAGVIQQQVQHGASERRMQATKRQSIARIRETQQAFGLERQAVQGAINTIRNIPTAPRTHMTLTASADTSAAHSALSGLDEHIRAVAASYAQADFNRFQAAAAAAPAPSGGGGGGRSRSAAPESSMAEAFRSVVRDEVMTVQVVG